MLHPDKQLTHELTCARDSQLARSDPFVAASCARADCDRTRVHAIMPASGSAGFNETQPPAASTSEVDDDADEAERWRRIFQPRVAAWSNGRGLFALLSTLEVEYPHVFGLVAPSDKAAPRPWIVTEVSERSVGLAFRRASRHLHPDRLTHRDLSVQVEAEEVLKVLGAAYDDSASWGTLAAATATDPISRTASISGDGTAGGTSLRDNIFGDMKPVVRDPPAAAAPPPADPAAKSARGGGGGFFAFGRGSKHKEGRASLDSATAGATAAYVGDSCTARAAGKATSSENPFGSRGAGDEDASSRPRTRTPFDDPSPGSLHSTGVSSDCLSAADALFSNRSSRASMTAQEAATATAAAAAAADAAGQLFGTGAPANAGGLFPAQVT